LSRRFDERSGSARSRTFASRWRQRRRTAAGWGSGDDAGAAGHERRDRLVVDFYNENGT
jgi:hypothetical protein